MFALMAIGAHHYTNGPSREQEQKQRIKFIILSVLLIASAIFLGRYAAGLLFWFHSLEMVLKNPLFSENQINIKNMRIRPQSDPNKEYLIDFYYPYGKQGHKKKGTKTVCTISVGPVGSLDKDKTEVSTTTVRRHSTDQDNLVVARNYALAKALSPIEASVRQEIWEQAPIRRADISLELD